METKCRVPRVGEDDVTRGHSGGLGGLGEVLRRLGEGASQVRAALDRGDQERQCGQVPPPARAGGCRIRIDAGTSGQVDVKQAESPGGQGRSPGCAP
ncbi:hypothetical protein Franean1_0244 [Parafrankia sp. EAN1pec]|nr:hypothetical protein Franean1_0244 [Frankia sp. EAN1pec]